MQRLLTSSIIALAAAVSVSAQDTTIKSETRIRADDAKAITVTGCLGGGPSTFVVTNVATAEAAGKKKSDDKNAVGTSGVAAGYTLIAPDGVSLAPHVGQKVELVGVVVEAAKRGDDDAKIETRQRTEVQREDAPDSKTETTTRTRVARGPTAQFAVTSVKMVSPICLQ
jgi:hypothetical protein